MCMLKRFPIPFEMSRIGLATTSRGESTVHRITQISGKQLTVAEPVRSLASTNGFLWVLGSGFLRGFVLKVLGLEKT